MTLVFGSSSLGRELEGSIQPGFLEGGSRLVNPLAEITVQEIARRAARCWAAYIV